MAQPSSDGQGPDPSPSAAATDPAVLLAEHTTGEGDVAAGPAGEEELRRRRRTALTAWAKVTASSKATETAHWLQRWRERNAVVDAAMLVRERDRSTAGTVLGSAVAFRLFLFFVPTVLLVVGIAGFVRSWFDPDQVVETSGLTGTMAEQIRYALSQGGTGRWLAVATGAWGVATTGRTLTKVLQASSALAWRTTLQNRVGVRLVGTVVGLLVSLALVSALLNRVRELGLAVAGVSLLGAAAVYAVGWLFLSQTLPRSTTDPGAGIPGAVMVGVTLVVLQAVSQFFLAGRISDASQLYGSMGAAITTLGWFFFMGRVIVLAFVVDAVAYERFGSLSQLVFALPVLRAIPRRFPAVRRFFDLDRESGAPAEVAPTGSAGSAGERAVGSVSADRLQEETGRSS